MKTTIDLPDRLLIDAKKLAAERRTTLRALIEAGLRMRIASMQGSDDTGKRKRLRLPTVRGGVPDDLDLANREAMHDWIRTR